MPSTSASTATKVADYGVAEDRSAELDGYAVNFVTIKQTHDLALRESRPQKVFDLQVHIPENKRTAEREADVVHLQQRVAVLAGGHRHQRFSIVRSA